MDVEITDWTLLGWQLFNTALIAGLLYLGFKVIRWVMKIRVIKK